MEFRYNFNQGDYQSGIIAPKPREIVRT